MIDNTVSHKWLVGSLNSNSDNKFNKIIWLTILFHIISCVQI